MGIELSIITLFVWGALPFACGIFPQKSFVDATKLESQFHNIFGQESGKQITRFWYNRGL